MNNLGSIQRLLANLIKSGRVSAVGKGVVRVTVGQLQSDWLQYFVPAAGAISVSRVPSVGESCVVLSESGDMSLGLVLCGVASNTFDTPSENADVHIVTYSDGAKISYDQSSGTLDVAGVTTVNVTSNDVIINSNKAVINSPENEVNGNLKVSGMLTAAGGLAVSGGEGKGGATITGDLKHTGGTITSDSIVKDGHVHKVNAIGANTGEPI